MQLDMKTIYSTIVGGLMLFVITEYLIRPRMEK